MVMVVLSLSHINNRYAAFSTEDYHCWGDLSQGVILLHGERRHYEKIVPYYILYPLKATPRVILPRRRGLRAFALALLDPYPTSSIYEFGC